MGQKLFKVINRHLDCQGLTLRNGSIVDATIIAAPGSTKNQSDKHDLEMHQTKKGKPWHFGIKLHIGTEDVLGMIHNIRTTPANTYDITQASHLLHGQERRVCGDAGYTCIEQRDEHRGRRVDWFIALRLGKRRQLVDDSLTARDETMKAQVRAKVEPPFLYIKRIFGYDKVRYRSLSKNTERLNLLAVFANLLIARKYLLT